GNADMSHVRQHARHNVTQLTQVHFAWPHEPTSLKRVAQAVAPFGRNHAINRPGDRMTYVPESMPQPTTMEAAAYAANIGFGSIIVNVEDRFFASHVPVFIDISDGSAKELRFHLAARNEMVQALNNSPHAVVIVRGPDGYISPKWYD